MMYQTMENNKLLTDLQDNLSNKIIKIINTNTCYMNLAIINFTYDNCIMKYFIELSNNLTCMEIKMRLTGKTFILQEFDDYLRSMMIMDKLVK